MFSLNERINPRHSLLWHSEKSLSPDCLPENTVLVAIG
jgi:hypothetical protein